MRPPLVPHCPYSPRGPLRTAALTACTVLLCLLVAAPGAWAMGSKGTAGRAGLHILTVWEEGTQNRIPVYVWYPTIRPERSSFLEPYTVTAAREGQPEEGKFPIVLMSHATAESGLSHHTTAQFLARHGFIVIAPTHPGDNFLDSSRIFTKRQITGRPRHLLRALDAVLAHEELGPIADPTHLSVIGYGTGATAALMLAGAHPTVTGLGTYCIDTPDDDPYCSNWALERLAPLMRITPPQLTPEADKPWRDSRIDTVALIAPAYGMLFDSSSFTEYTAKTMLVEAENDAMNPPARHVQYLRTLLPADTPYFILVGATSFMLHAPCNERMRANYPAICKDPGNTSRDNIHSTLHDLLLRFLSADK